MRRAEERSRSHPRGRRLYLLEAASQSAFNLVLARLTTATATRAADQAFCPVQYHPIDGEGSIVSLIPSHARVSCGDEECVAYTLVVFAVVLLRVRHPGDLIKYCAFSCEQGSTMAAENRLDPNVDAKRHSTCIFLDRQRTRQGSCELSAVPQRKRCSLQFPACVLLHIRVVPYSAEAPTSPRSSRTQCKLTPVALPGYCLRLTIPPEPHQATLSHHLTAHLFADRR